MQISFNCPKCSNVLQAETNWSGQNTLCPHCKNMIVIPSFSTLPQAADNNGTTVRQTASFSGEKEFFLLKVSNALFARLRLLSLFSSLSKAGGILGKTGAVCYLILGILLFFISCKRASDAASAWLEVFGGLTLLAGLVIFAVCSMYMFKLFNRIFSKEKSCSVPLPFLNTVSALSLAAVLYFLIVGITAVCIMDNAWNLLYTNLIYCAASAAVFIVSIFPAAVNASANEQSSVDNAFGTALFMARAALFAIPFTWCCDAVCRIVNILIHLGAEKVQFAAACSTSSAGLPQGILYPLYAWCGYIVFDFVISAVKALIDRR